jgi:hypothetical protein
MKNQKAFHAIWSFVENHNASIFFSIGIVFAYFFSHKAAAFSIDHNLNYAAFYAAVFDLSGIFTAFLFGFFTYSISSGSPFMVAARNTAAFRAMLTYVKRAVVLGALLTVITIPTLIVEPLPIKRFAIEWYYMMIWFGVFLGAASSFWRATRLFWIFASQD